MTFWCIFFCVPEAQRLCNRLGGGPADGLGGFLWFEGELGDAAESPQIIQHRLLNPTQPLLKAFSSSSSGNSMSGKEIWGVGKCLVRGEIEAA